MGRDAFTLVGASQPGLANARRARTECCLQGSEAVPRVAVQTAKRVRNKELVSKLQELGVESGDE